MSSYVPGAGSVACAGRAVRAAAAVVVVLLLALLWAPAAGLAASGDAAPSPGLALNPITSLPDRLSVLQSDPTSPAQAAPPAPAPSPAEPLRVGIQAGHWKASELPDELAALRGSGGAVGDGWREVDVNLDVASRVAAILAQAGIQVDLLPSTIPIDYKADAFVAIHADANGDSGLSGYKLARAVWSSIPAKDDDLIAAISGEYQSATGLKLEPHTITQNMLRYYAFNHRLQHSVDPATPAVILEMGFLTNADDRALLTQQPDRVAQGIAAGILKFLGVKP